MIGTGEGNRLCHESGIKNESCSCFLCGYQQSCDRYSTESFEYKRDHTGAYVVTTVDTTLI